MDAGGSTAKFWRVRVSLHYNIGFSARELRAIERIMLQHQESLVEAGMRTLAPKAGEKIKMVGSTKDTLTVDLADGRTLSTPLAWYPRLLHATPEQRNNFTISGAGFGIHWPDVDEDLSVHGMLAGAAAPGVTASGNTPSASAPSASSMVSCAAACQRRGGAWHYTGDRWPRAGIGSNEPLSRRSHSVSRSQLGC